MPRTPRSYVLCKYLPARSGCIEMGVTASSVDDYDINSVFFSVQHGHVVIREEVTYYMLAARLCLNDDIDGWVAELLPAALAADNFLERADMAYEANC